MTAAALSTAGLVRIGRRPSSLACSSEVVIISYVTVEVCAKSWQAYVMRITTGPTINRNSYNAWLGCGRPVMGLRIGDPRSHTKQEEHQPRLCFCLPKLITCSRAASSIAACSSVQSITQASLNVLS